MATVFPVDGNTVALWLLDETSHPLPAVLAAAEEVGNYSGNLGMVEQTQNYPYIATKSILIPQLGVCRAFEGNSSRYLISGGQASGLETVLQGSCSFEFIWLAKRDGTTEGWFSYYPSPSGGETEAKNYQIAADITDTRKGAIGWEKSAGTDVSYTTTAELWGAEAQYSPHYIAIVKTSSGSTSTVKWYVDGALIETSSAIDNPTGGTDSNMRWHLGLGWNGTTCMGWMDEFRISNSARSQGEITAAYDRWVALYAPANAIAPVIQNVSPSAPGTIGVNGTFSFEVYDVSPGLRTVQVQVTIGGAAYVVHDGSAFAQDFSASTRTGAGTQGSPYVYTVRRAGGWFASPTFKVVAIDQAGNDAG